MIHIGCGISSGAASDTTPDKGNLKVFNIFNFLCKITIDLNGTRPSIRDGLALGLVPSPHANLAPLHAGHAVSEQDPTDCLFFLVDHGH